MDLVTGLPALDDEFDAILTITDKFSKMITLIACRTKDDAQATATRFYHGFYCRFGLPRLIISDRDVRFVSISWRSLFKLMGTELLMSTAFHPQTDGLSERTNQTVENILRTLVGYGINEQWQSKLAEIEFHINRSKHLTTRGAPFEVLYGFKPRAVLEAISQSQGFADGNSIVQATLQNRAILRTEVSDAILDSRQP